MADPKTSQPSPPVQPSKPKRVWGRPFQKGQSGNPGGKTKQKESLAEIARAASPKALRTMISIMENPKASFAVRAYCSDRVMDRAYGKPGQSTHLFVSGNQRPLSQLTDAELMQIIEDGRRRANPPALAGPTGPTLDLQPESEPGPEQVVDEAADAELLDVGKDVGRIEDEAA